MSYFEQQEEWEKRGVCLDLFDCLWFNPQPFVADDIEEVLAVWEGENDCDDWRWIIRLKAESALAKREEKQFVFLQGGCDYTGWDCRSWAVSQFAETAERAAKFALGDFELGDSSPRQAGLGHAIGMLGGLYSEKRLREVYGELMHQLEKGRALTWREFMRDEFPPTQ